MSDDIVPELLDRIREYTERTGYKDAALDKLHAQIAAGSATQITAHNYALDIGQGSAAALDAAVTPEALPNGHFYWNIGERTVKPLLQENFTLTQDAANEVQKALDAADGIGLNGVRADLPADRIRGILDHLDNADDFERVRSWLREAVTNCTESFHDDWVKSNAEFRFRSGMAPTIIRKGHFGMCKWCAGLVGTYDYEAVRYSSDVFRRHAYCRCSVTFQNGKSSQDVWSKRIWQSSPEELERRKTLNLERFQVPPEERTTIGLTDSADSGLQNVGSDGNMETGGSKLKGIGLQFFAEKGLSNQPTSGLRKGIRSLQKKIAIHEGYLKNPTSHVPDWDNLRDSQKQSLLNHWRKEIEDFSTSIENRRSELKRRGENDE